MSDKTIPSVRKAIESILDQADRQSNRDNLTLYLSRLCREIDNPNNKSHEAKESALLHLLGGYRPDTLALYRHSLGEWRRMHESRQDALCFEMETTTPLIVGKGDHNVHEFGISLQTPWGTPLIPGTAVKGVLSSLAASQGGAEWLRKSEAHSAGHYGLAMFGGIDSQQGPMAGGVGFMDAWWIPSKTANPPPFMEDIINVHYRSYYQKKGWPHGMDSPLPNKFLAIRPGERFLFVFQGPRDWCTLAREMLKEAAHEQGLGAKTRVGYGRLRYRKSDTEFRAELPTLNDSQLAELFATAGNKAALRESFTEECRRRKYSQELHKLFVKFRPAAVLLADLKSKRPLTWKEAGAMRKEYETQLPAAKIDPADTDVQMIFSLCLPLAPNGDAGGTWLARFAPTAEQILAQRTAAEIESLLLDYSEQWPPLQNFRPALTNHPLLSEGEKESCLLALDMRLEER